MGYKGLLVTRCYRGLKQVTTGYKGLQWVTGAYTGLQRVTRGCKRLHEVTMDYKGLHRDIDKRFSNYNVPRHYFLGLFCITLRVKKISNF